MCMSFTSDMKLLLQQWVAGLSSDLEVAAVCRVLLSEWLRHWIAATRPGSGSRSNRCHHGREYRHNVSGKASFQDSPVRVSAHHRGSIVVERPPPAAGDMSVGAGSCDRIVSEGL